MKKLIWLAFTALALAGCDDGGGEDNGAGGAGGSPEPDRGLADASTDAGVSDGGAGGAGGGAGGAGGEGGGGGAGGVVVPPVEERCPEAQAGTFLLVLHGDRIDAYRQRDFAVSYVCEFIPLAAYGITQATGFARGADGNFYVVHTAGDRGQVHAFDPNGTLVDRVESNVNLAGVDGIWNTFGDDFVAWSGANQNFYRLSAEGRYMGTWEPPQWQGSRVPRVTDVVFLSQDSVLMTFGDRPAKLFKAPFAPDFPEDEVGPGNAVLGVPTDEGVKILMSAQIGGSGNGYGVVLYKAAERGRAPPELERVLIAASEITDGVDLLALDTGLLVLDSALGGSARISSFNLEGALQMEIPLQGAGNPISFMLAPIFPDF
jgi:hypothetical protein